MRRSIEHGSLKNSSDTPIWPTPTLAALLVQSAQIDQFLQEIPQTPWTHNLGAYRRCISPNPRRHPPPIARSLRGDNGGLTRERRMAAAPLDACRDCALRPHWRWGRWVGRWMKLFTGIVIGVLVMLSIILTASVLYPDIRSGHASDLAYAAAVCVAESRMTPLTRVWMLVLRGYLFVTGGLVSLRIVQLSLGGR
jgi:hypothetical protein